ncbi:6-pyruvoyl-tetrahydropterin synthase-related protein [Neoroseomonas soli]|uniref:Membrane protein 6-pyruvoyl-tetrahydropterin synthase-related domain-containing protein n=1 Tax=Neoroseomonas soli TaxID=1081025 RepID=A0A9X9WSR3_9PROT|nr:6-pyruvoyl-tetrahydropterin synthase-related protein [Neoroseomonas soli]MBR0670192.1 hypothetical protein [Neoroseomonas soli]
MTAEVTRPPASGGVWIILVAAVLLGAPILLLGAPATDNAHYNLNWAEQFAALLASGVAVPRWLPDAFGGLGSPTFVFYAPLPFYATAPLLWLFGNVLDGGRIMGLVQVAMLAGSGLMMRRWLLQCGAARHATVGSLIYMAAPYHLFDIYVRGSFGEIAAYAALPLLVAALDRCLRGHCRHVLWLAFATALLLLSHLPSAMLAAVFVAIPYAFLRLASAARPMAARMRGGAAVLAGATGGIVLAAFQVVPALAMLSANSFEHMTTGRYDSAGWLLLRPDAWLSAGYMTFVATAAFGVAALAIAGLAFTRGGVGGEPRIWAVLTLLGGAFMAGILPALWSDGSPLTRVQFPWRMLLVLDFTSVTALVLAAEHSGRPRRATLAVWFLTVLPALFVLAAAAYPILRTTTTNAWRETYRTVVAYRPDPGEYLPAGHWLGPSAAGVASIDHVLQLLASIGPGSRAWGEPEAEVGVRVVESGPLGERLAVAAPYGGRVVLRRFDFPAWHLVGPGAELGLPREPHGPDRLLSFRVPPGEHTLELVWIMPLSARIAALASVLGWFAWGLAALSWRFLPSAGPIGVPVRSP